MRTPVTILALTLLALPAAGQALRPAPDTSASDPTPPPGYSSFTAAPLPTVLPPEIRLAERAGTPGISGGPVNSIPFSGQPYNAFPHDGGQISPAMQNTSDAWRVVPDLSK